MPGKPMNAADFQSAIEGLIRDAIWDGVSRDAITAILAAQAEVQKHKR